MPVKWCAELVFLLNNVGNRACARHTFLDDRDGQIWLYNAGFKVVVLARFALVFLLVIVDYRNLRGDNIQLAADKFFADADHFLTAFRALFVVEIDDNFLALNAFGKFLAGKTLSSRMRFHVDRFNRWLNSACRVLLLGFVKQRKLLRTLDITELLA